MKTIASVFLFIWASLGFAESPLLLRRPISKQAATNTSPFATLTAHWRFDETSTPWVDHVGAISMVATSHAPSSVSGKITNAVSYSTLTGDALFTGDNARLSFGAEDFSVSAWVKFNAFGTLNVIAQKGAANSSAQYCLEYFQGDANMSFTVRDSGGAHVGKVVSTASIATNVWYFVVATHRNGVNVGIQINNAAEDTAVYTNGCFDDPGIFTSGGTDGIYFSDFVVDELSLYRSTLSSTDRTSLYGGGAGLAH